MRQNKCKAPSNALIGSTCTESWRFLAIAAEDRLLGGLPFFD